MTEGQIKVASAKELTTERIRGLIHAGEFLPGNRLSIEDLSRRFALSRTPVRDALWELSAEGLVEIVPRVGVFVRTISAQEVTEVYQVKLALEPLMARYATERATAEQREDFFRSLEQLRATVGAEDVDHYVELLERRRHALLEMAGSQVLLSVFSAIDGRVRLLRYRNLSQPGQLSVSAEQHVRIAEYVRSKDPDGAFDAMRFHIADAEKRVRNLLRSLSAESQGEAAGTDGIAAAGRQS